LKTERFLQILTLTLRRVLTNIPSANAKNRNQATEKPTKRIEKENTEKRHPNVNFKYYTFEFNIILNDNVGSNLILTLTLTKF
jgi:hypothetical protein